MLLSSWKLESIVSSNGGGGGGGGTAVIHKPTGRRYEYTFADSLIRNIPHPPFIQESVWEAQMSHPLKFRSSDVFIATYSKCGTTLAEQIVLLLLNGGRDDELNPLHKNTLDKESGKIGKIWTEMAVVDGLRGLQTNNNCVDNQKACMGEGKARMSVTEFDALPSPRILKTHAPTKLFLDQKKVAAKVIYVTRNPFDACVSCYYHVSAVNFVLIHYPYILHFSCGLLILSFAAQTGSITPFYWHALRRIFEAVAK